MSQKVSLPLVSVVIPCYNAELYISTALSSVLNQTYRNVEVIVVNDGSTDSSEKIIGSFPNVKYIYQNNMGVSKARNVGILSSAGEYILPLDADDVLLPTCIEEKLQYAIKNSCDLVFSWVGIVDVNLNELSTAFGGNPTTIMSDLFVFAPPSIISPSSTLIRKSIFEEVGYFDETMSVSADLDLWLRLAEEKKIGKVEKKLTLYRLVPGSLNTNLEKQIKDMHLIFNKYELKPYYSKYLLKLKQGFYFSLAGNGWMKKKYFQFIKYYLLFLISKFDKRNYVWDRWFC